MKKIFLSFIVLNLIFNASSTTIINFESANPFSFKDIIKKIHKQKSQEVYGILTLPKGIDGTNKKVPLIIGVAGSLDWGTHHLEYMKMYQDMGIATFELQSFRSRNITSTVGSQITVTTAMMILDSYRSLDVLAEHPNIDIKKVAITGWSLGGGVTLYSAWEPLKNAIKPTYDFVAHLAYYPPCFAIPDNISFTDAAIHILIGELDNWVPSDACVELVDILQEEQVNIDVTVYKEAHHSFDRDAPIIISENAYNFTDCRCRIKNNGIVVTNKFFRIPMSTPFLQKIGLSFCAKRGPTFGGHPESKQAAFDFSRKFMKQYLLESNE